MSSATWSDDIQGAAPAERKSPALFIAILYLVIAASWILVSDAVLEALLRTKEEVGALQTAKGLAFVLITALLLYLLIQRAWRARTRIQTRADEMGRRLEMLVSNLPGVVYRCANEPSWPFEYVSAGCLRLTGYGPDELVGAKRVPFGDLIVQEDRERVWHEVQQALHRRVPFAVTYRLEDRAGRVRHVIDYGQGIFGPDERVMALEGYLVDVSDRRAIEEQYLHAQKMEVVARLAAGIAHDFNNVLTGILGYVQLLRNREEGDPPPREVLDEISRGGERAAELARQILGFVRRPDGEIGPVSVVQILRTLQRFLVRTIGEDVSIRMDLCPEKALVRAEPSQIEQIVMNLAVNARDAMPRGGHLVLAVDEVELDLASAARYPSLEPGRHVRLRISDDGCGMDESTRARIYEPFFTTKAEGRGTGLGLSTVFGIVTGHHGAIDVTSAPGKGTHFTIFLPCARDERTEGTRIVESREVPEASPGARVLVVEDDAQVRRLLHAMLSNRGYEVLATETGREALELAASRTPRIELMICDFLLPDMSAAELEAAWKQRIGALPPTIVISGYDEERLAELDFDAESLRFLSKPFTQTQLAACVEEMLGAR